MGFLTFLSIVTTIALFLNIIVFIYVANYIAKNPEGNNGQKLSIWILFVQVLSLVTVWILYSNIK